MTDMTNEENPPFVISLNSTLANTNQIIQIYTCTKSKEILLSFHHSKYSTCSQCYFSYVSNYSHVHHIKQLVGIFRNISYKRITAMLFTFIMQISLTNNLGVLHDYKALLELITKHQNPKETNPRKKVGS